MLSNFYSFTIYSILFPSVANTATYAPPYKTKPFLLGCTLTTDYDTLGWLFFFSWGKQDYNEPQESYQTPLSYCYHFQTSVVEGGRLLNASWSASPLACKETVLTLHVRRIACEVPSTSSERI